LAIDPKTGMISGTPAAVAARFSYTVTASNAGGSTTARVEITVTDAAPRKLSYGAHPATYFLDKPVTPNAPSRARGAVATSSGSPALPPGLLLDAATGVITGTPLLTGQGTYRVTASNSGGSVFCDLVLTIIARPPAGLAYARNPVTVTRGVAMT